jgi:hypothetical protein
MNMHAGYHNDIEASAEGQKDKRFFGCFNDAISTTSVPQLRDLYV